jgi:adenylate cyclase
MSGKIFISYRRGDEAGSTGRLFDILEAAFARDRLFLDVDNIGPGLDFVQVLNDRIAESGILLAVIGSRWLTAANPDGSRRLDDPCDFVRLEIQAALEQSKLVVPVLIGDARMPCADDLPQGLKSLATRNAVRITHERFRADAEGLIKAISRVGPPEGLQYRAPTPAAAIRSEPEGAAPAAAERASIAVLPFANLSGSPDQEYFADGITEEIITALSRAKSFFVVARNSSFTYKGRAVDVRQIGSELGVRYVLEGSVRRFEQRVRITGQLIEAASGQSVWAEKYDSDLRDIFELQDRITESIAGVIEPSLYTAEISRARAKPTENLGAYDLYLRALPNHYEMTPASYADAISLLAKAVELDPHYSHAKAFLAFSYVTRMVTGWAEAGDREKALALAREALASDRNDPNTLRCAGHVLGWFGEVSAGVAALDRALELNPNSAVVLNSAGWVYCYALRTEKAIECFQRAVRLSPRDPEKGYTLSGMALAYLLAGQDTQAEECAARSLQEMPNWSSAYRQRIFALVRLGRLDQAKETAAAYLRRVPHATVRHAASMWPVPRFRDDFENAMRIVGLPE